MGFECPATGLALGTGYGIWSPLQVPQQPSENDTPRDLILTQALPDYLARDY